MNKDIKLLNEIMSYKNIKDVKDNRFFWIYLFTNENIKEYYSYIDFKNKDVLCVTSSGDHTLNALLSGAKSISSFDINPIAKYYSELKIAAIKTLSLEEFILFFYDKKLLTYKYFFNKKIYKKISNNLQNEYKVFWDYFFNTYNKMDIFKSYLICEDYLTLKGLLEVNSYLNEENYYKLRNILNNTKINYYDLNLKEIGAINNKFDIILLSNVSAFLERVYDKDYLKNLKETLDIISKKNTKVVVNYYYDNLLYGNHETTIYNKKLVSEYFNADEYEYKWFESAFNKQLNLGLRKLTNNYDKVLLTKNKK